MRASCATPSSSSWSGGGGRLASSIDIASAGRVLRLRLGTPEIFPKRASVAPKTRRGTGWSRALAASTQALRAAVPSNGQGAGEGAREGAHRGNPFFNENDI
jgi:hypothetical protein